MKFVDDDEFLDPPLNYYRLSRVLKKFFQPQ